MHGRLADHLDDLLLPADCLSSPGISCQEEDTRLDRPLIQSRTALMGAELSHLRLQQSALGQCPLQLSNTSSQTEKLHHDPGMTQSWTSLPL